MVELAKGLAAREVRISRRRAPEHVLSALQVADEVGAESSTVVFARVDAVRLKLFGAPRMLVNGLAFL